MAAVVGRLFLVANAAAGDALGRANVELTEGETSDGFYEAVCARWRRRADAAKSGVSS